MSAIQEISRGIPVQPLGEEFRGRFRKLMDRLHPEPERRNDLSNEHAAKDFWKRAGLTLIDVHAIDFSPLVETTIDMFSKAEDVIPEVRLKRAFKRKDKTAMETEVTIPNLTMSEVAGMYLDFSYLRESDPASDENIISFAATLPVIARETKGDALGIEVEKLYRKYASGK